MKRILAVLLATLMMLSATCVSVCGTEKTISVVVDGQNLTFDQPPVIVNDRTLVPLRAIFEALDATVEWNEATRTVTSTRNDTTVSVTIDSDKIYVNGEEKIIDVPAQIISDRTMVPVRAISESFDCNVEWIASDRTVKVTTNNKDVFANLNPFILDLLGQRQSTIAANFGPIEDYGFLEYGDYYKHQYLCSYTYYTFVPDEELGTIDEVIPVPPVYAVCTDAYVYLPELIYTSDKTEYTPDELAEFLGDYEYSCVGDGGYEPLHCYVYSFCGYTLFVESYTKNPQITFAYLSRKPHEALEKVIENFESTPLTMQGEAYTSIAEDDNYVTAMQQLISWDYLDLDRDGTDELIVSSMPVIENDDYWGSCFSIWDVAESGEAVCLLAKRGQSSRVAHNYSIIEYGEDILLCDFSHVGSSGGCHTTTALYSITNGKMELYKDASYYVEYERYMEDGTPVISTEEYTIDGVPYPAEDVEYFLTVVYNKTLIEQDMGRD